MKQQKEKQHDKSPNVKMSLSRFESQSNIRGLNEFQDTQQVRREEDFKILYRAIFTNILSGNKYTMLEDTHRNTEC